MGRHTARVALLVAGMIGAATASGQTTGSYVREDSAQQDTTPADDGWRSANFPGFKRGWYTGLDVASVATHTTLPCDTWVGFGCTAGETLRFQNNMGDGPNMAATFGYRFFRFLALQGTATLLSGSDSNNVRGQSRNEQETEIKGGYEAHISARVDLPITRRLALFGTYGYGIKHVTWSTNITPDESNPLYWQCCIDQGSIYQDKTKSRTWRPATVGLDWWYTDRMGVFVEYMPPQRGGGRKDDPSNFAFTETLLGLEFNW